MKTFHFLNLPVKKMKPTKKHRPAIWEMMLGTVIAMNSKGEMRYFDYDFEAVVKFAELGGDERYYNFKRGVRYDNGKGDTYLRPNHNQKIVWTNR